MRANFIHDILQDGIGETQRKVISKCKIKINEISTFQPAYEVV